MPQLNVLLLENVNEVAQQILEAHGFAVRRIDRALPPAELAQALEGVHVLGIRSKTHLTAAHFEGARSLMAVGCFCIGTNQVDVHSAMRRGVPVFNAPFSNTRSVAEMVIGEIIMLSRQLGDRNCEVHRGTWRKTADGSREVRGKTLGIVGYGNIGTQVGILAEFLGMRVVFVDTSAQLPLGNAQAAANLDAVLAQSDFVTLHVPETPQTKGMIDAERIAKMKRGAYLINASRGTVVDIAALARALTDGHLGGAAIDVYPSEPDRGDTADFVTPLQKLPNTILTPHIGGSTLEAQENIGKEVAHTLVNFVTRGSTVGAVNFPLVDLAPSPGTWRIAHVHQNVPGVMRDVNRVVGDAGTNIHAQLLSTNADIGYLVVDLDDNEQTDVVDGLRALSTTISARVVRLRVA